MTKEELLALDLTGRTIKIRDRVAGLVTKCWTELDEETDTAWIHINLGEDPTRSYTHRQFFWEAI